MPESKNTFIKSKMNKDLDDRILPSGEYRDAQNVSVSRSESADVGALENTLGTIAVTDFGLSAECNVEIIGYLADDIGNRIFVMMTDYSDGSSDRLSNKAYILTNRADQITGGQCYIGVYDANTNDGLLIVSGAFLNFSQTHPITGINLLEDFLFWTDNRNQPRKINVTTAINNPGYYTTEDHISVAKLYPWQAISLLDKSAGGITGGNDFTTLMKDVVSPSLPGWPKVTGWSAFTAGSGTDYPNYCNGAPCGTPGGIFDTTGGSGGGLRIECQSSGPGSILAINRIANPGRGYTNGDIVTLVGGTATVTLTVTDIANPELDATYAGDYQFFKDNFFRLSYRFKFDDGEYSLIAPFTPIVFVPEQDGFWIDVDDSRTIGSTDVAFMRNKINQAGLRIPAPLPIFYNTGGSGTQGDNANWDEVYDLFKIVEVEILYKSTNGETIKVIDVIPYSQFSTTSDGLYSYTYEGRKPWKTIPSKQIPRVSDIVPLRALSQEVVANRVIYGNYLDKGTEPNGLPYDAIIQDKTSQIGHASGITYLNTDYRKEFQNHTLKQNRTYQAGIILCDRYGRQSNVILSEYDHIEGSDFSSTVLNPYKTLEWINDTSGTAAGEMTSWPGDELAVEWHNTIPTEITDPNYPGLFYSTSSGFYQNATGWYSAKVVVKQTEQDYYNVYVPGLLRGNVADSPQVGPENPYVYFVIQGDNINKVPRSLLGIGPEEKIFRTSRPRNQQEDLAWIKTYLKNAGILMEHEGEVFELDKDSLQDQKIKSLLQEKDKLETLQYLNDKDNSSVEMYLRAHNTYELAAAGFWNPYRYSTRSYFPQVPITTSNGALIPGADNVVIVGKGSEQGLYYYDTSASPAPVTPTDSSNYFYDVEEFGGDPLIGKVSCNSIVNKPGVLGGASGKMRPQLAIYETTPNESLLDIYWETGSCMPIDILNNQITAVGVATPSKVAQYAAAPQPSPTLFGTLSEATTPVADATGDFIVLDGTGVPITPGTMTLTLSSVLDVNMSNVTSEWSLVNGTTPGTHWRLQNNAIQYCDPANRLRIFWFKGVITASGQIGYMYFMDNIPNIPASITAPANPSSHSGTIAGGNIITVEGVNGCADTSLQKRDMHYNIKSQKNAASGNVSFFNLVESDSLGNIDVFNIPMTVAEAATGPFEVIVEANDRPTGFSEYQTSVTLNITIT